MRTIPSQTAEPRERVSPEPVLPETGLRPPDSPKTSSRRRLPRLKFSLLWKLGVVAALIGGAAYYMTREGEARATGTVARVARGTLPITVLEKGTVQALESQNIKSEVRGQTKILEIVDEGYQVTEEDVKNKKVLVRLDDSEMLEDKVQQEIQYQGAKASFIEAKSQYEIQQKTNESEITAAQLAVNFARIDFEKYLGAEMGKSLLAKYALSEEAAKSQATLDIGPVEQDLSAPVANAAAPVDAAQNADGAPPAPPPNDAAAPVATPAADSAAPAPGDSKDGEQQAEGRGEKRRGGKGRRGDRERNADSPAQQESPALSPSNVAADAAEMAKQASLLPVQELSDIEEQTRQMSMEARKARGIDYAALVADPSLGGDAMQKKQELEAKITLAKEQLNTSQRKLEGTLKLFEKNFVTELDKQGDEMSVSRNKIELESSERNLDLFIQYEFPKQVEKFLSDYEEAQRKLARTEKQAVAKSMQDLTRVQSSMAQYNLQEQRLNEILERISKCAIVAERTGLVVYAGSDEPWRRQEPIEKGSTVNEQQELLTIPDMTQMAVEAKIHESQIKKIKLGQKATVKVVGVADEVLTGSVVKVNILPDATQRWMNPDLKLYPVQVSIEGTHDWLRPGRTAEVEIKVTELPDVVYVPIQAVSESNGERVAYAVTPLGPERRVVQVGEMNEKYVEIKSGLQEGERVLLRAPEEAEQAEEEAAEEEKNGQPNAAPEGGAEKTGGEQSVPATPAAAPAAPKGGAVRGS